MGYQQEGIRPKSYRRHLFFFKLDLMLGQSDFLVSVQSRVCEAFYEILLLQHKYFPCAQPLTHSEHASVISILFGKMSNVLIVVGVLAALCKASGSYEIFKLFS